MTYFSLNFGSQPVSFREALLTGQAPDKGLYFPTEIPKYSPKNWLDFKSLSLTELAFKIIEPYIKDDIPAPILQDFINKTLSFSLPIVKINESIKVLELFHGPTLAFKDIGAKFMSLCLGYCIQNTNKTTTVLVATSGDTGGAVAQGFLNVAGVEVVILYPKGRVSALQEQQLTTHGSNIKALEVEGSFDDCQAMVKEAFMDTQLVELKNLTSANSINVARWLPQQFYYLHLWQSFNQAIDVVSVPSGNFGNIAALLIAQASGLPIKHVIAACNANKIIPDYFKSQNFIERSSIATISNAMDIAKPSNFVRIQQIFNNNFNALTSVMSAYSFSDDETKDAMRYLFKNYNYIADPHGAVAFLGLKNYLNNKPQQQGVFVETAHPYKFSNIVEETLVTKLTPPVAIQNLLHVPQHKTKIKPFYKDLKDYLLST